MPIEMMENYSELFCNKSLNGLVWHHFDLFGAISFHLHNERRYNVFVSRQKLRKYM